MESNGIHEVTRDIECTAGLALPTGADRLFTLAFTPSITKTHHHHDHIMTSPEDKENIADGLLSSAPLKVPQTLSPRKPSRKTRSKSIGPGGLGDLEAPALKQSNGNRRKVFALPSTAQIVLC